MSQNSIQTRKARLVFPQFVPVTTFGGAYPLDDLIRPYLPRMSRSMLVAYHYARQMPENFESELPLWVDSGGFAALFDNAQVIERDGLGVIVRTTEDGSVEEITPSGVLDLQERVADIAVTLDFPIPPDMQKAQARERQALTLANARWMLENRRRRDLPLYVPVVGLTLDDYVACARACRDLAAEGIAIGGLVPRARNWDLVESIVAQVRAIVPDRPLHVFGIGQPERVRDLFALGVDSVDSSSFVRAAADGTLWGYPQSGPSDLSPLERTQIALCNLALVSEQGLPLRAACAYRAFLTF